MKSQSQTLRTTGREFYTAVQTQGLSHDKQMRTTLLSSVEPMAVSHSLPAACRYENTDEHPYLCGDPQDSSNNVDAEGLGNLPDAARSISPSTRHLDSALETIISDQRMCEALQRHLPERQEASSGTGQASPRNMSKSLQQSSLLMQPPKVSNNAVAQRLHAAVWPPVLPHTGIFLENEKRHPGNFQHNFHQPTEMYAAADECLPSVGVSMVKGLGNLGGSHDVSCMEQLLVHCATAVENSDATLAQQIMWVLNNIVSTEGDPNQRVTAYFLRALISRASRVAPNLARDLNAKVCSSKILSAIELAGFVDLTPWHRFGFSAANGAIMEAVGRKASVHILDFSITHCMQWPTLIEALSKRPEGPPHVRLTVHGARPQVPPLLNMCYEELGMKLGNFARSKNVPFQFRVLPQEAEQLNRSVFDLHEDEALAVNCQMRLHYIPDETIDHACPRAEFLRLIRSLDPTIVTFVDEDANLTSTSLVARLRAAFNYLWIPFDALDTFLPRDSKQRLQYEGDIGSKIENIIACEGRQRMERLESKERWMQRIRNAHLQSVPFSEAVISEVKSMLVEHAAGWGLKKEEDALLLTWKGHNVVFATALVSAQS